MSEKLSCVSEQGKSGLLWTVFDGEPFCSPRIASFADADKAREYLSFHSTITALESKLAKCRKALEEISMKEMHQSFSCANHGEFNRYCTKCLAATTLEETK
jgi:hypothetical protein